jgi:hypothetical protein
MSNGGYSSQKAARYADIIIIIISQHDSIIQSINSDISNRLRIPPIRSSASIFLSFSLPSPFSLSDSTHPPPPPPSRQLLESQSIHPYHFPPHGMRTTLVYILICLSHRHTLCLCLSPSHFSTSSIPLLHNELRDHSYQYHHTIRHTKLQSEVQCAVAGVGRDTDCDRLPVPSLIAAPSASVLFLPFWLQFYSFSVSHKRLDWFPANRRPHISKPINRPFDSRPDPSCASPPRHQVVSSCAWQPNAGKTRHPPLLTIPEPHTPPVTSFQDHL